MTARIMRTDAAPLAGTGDRIPAALQKIFIKGQQGEDIMEPPSDHSAFKIFPIRHAPQARQKLKTEGDPSRIRAAFSLRGSLRRRNQDELDMSGSAHSTESALSRRRGSRLKSLRRPSVDSSMEQLDRQLKELDALSKKNRRGGRRNAAGSSIPPSSFSRKNSEESLTSEASTCSTEPKTSTMTSKSPKVFVDVMLRTRGYSQDCFSTLETSYFNEPTDLQKASYHAGLEDTVRSQNSDVIRDVLKCGISLNPCNHFGESILHTACRLGLENSVRVMLECGTSVQVSDSSGRPPLHAALSSCEANEVIVEMLLKKDRHLMHLKDQHGATPLEYIKKEDWGRWIDFLYSKRDSIWPHRSKRLDGIAESSTMMHEKPNSAPIADPENALTLEMAKMVANGKLSPEEACFLVNGGLEDEEDLDESNADSNSARSDDDDTLSVLTDCVELYPGDMDEDEFAGTEWACEKDSEDHTWATSVCSDTRDDSF